MCQTKSKCRVNTHLPNKSLQETGGEGTRKNLAERGESRYIESQSKQARGALIARAL
jgi:hypothetical protein